MYDKSQLNESGDLAQIDDGQLVFFFEAFFTDSFLISGIFHQFFCNEWVFGPVLFE